MRDTHLRTNDEGDIEALREVECCLRERIGLLGISRVEHRNMRCRGIIMRVLLILRRVHAWVIGNKNDKPRAYPGIRAREERIRGNVEPYMLHGDKRALPSRGNTDRDFKRDLLIRAPLCMNRTQVRKVLQGLS